MWFRGAYLMRNNGFDWWGKILGIKYVIFV